MMFVPKLVSRRKLFFFHSRFLLSDVRNIVEDYMNDGYEPYNHDVDSDEPYTSNPSDLNLWQVLSESHSKLLKLPLKMGANVSRLKLKGITFDSIAPKGIRFADITIALMTKIIIKSIEKTHVQKILSNNFFSKTLFVFTWLSP